MISEEFIMKKLLKYAASSEGKKKIKEIYGVKYDPKFNESKLRAYGERMKTILMAHIKPLIKSIEDSNILISDIEVSEDGKRVLTLYFDEEALRRESLYPDGYPDGLKNIVLLFVNGYRAKRHVHGVWKNSKYSGEIVSRISRPSNDFLNQAVNEFNSKFGKKARAVLQEPYK